MKKKNHIKVRFSTILLCCLAIVLCAAPALQADSITVPANETRDINDLVDGVLIVEPNGTANLLTGASVTQSIYVFNGGTLGGTLNMYSGTVGWFISVSPDASMTVYGTDFEVSNGTIGPDGNWTPDPLVGRGTLTGDYGDGSSINLWVWSNIAINLKPPSTIDIKPGSDLNNINLKSKGVVPVAVLSTDDFDASTIDTDTDTVKFAGVSPVRWTMEDVDDDGDEDMLFHFRTKDLELDENSTKATLTVDGIAAGTDTVRIVQSKKE